MNNYIITVKKNNISFLVEDSEELHQDVGYNFWKEKYINWENNTFNILDNFLVKEKDYLDIGSWVGPTALYSSFLCRKVVAVEPDPVASKILSKNIKLNSINNIFLIEKALACSEESYIVSNKFFGDSMTKVSSNPEAGIKVNSINFEELIEMGDFSLIKMDIEGSEFEVIPKYSKTLNAAKIPLYISIHSPFFEDGDHKAKILFDSLIGIKKIFNEYGEQIPFNEIKGGFSSYLLCW